LKNVLNNLFNFGTFYQKDIEQAYQEEQKWHARYVLRSM
jgi:hypothetical protein